MSRHCALALLLLLPMPLIAAEPTTGPIIEGYGASFVIDNADVPLIKDHVYRVFWEITEYEGTPDAVNRELDVVARFLNLHAKNGVPLENMHLAVVMHGAALINALNEEAYQRRQHRDNPNRDLMQKLAAAGVQFFVCGQSMGFRGFDKSELMEPVKLATSAMTMVHQLQFEGYTMLH